MLSIARTITLVSLFGTLALGCDKGGGAAGAGSAAPASTGKAATTAAAAPAGGDPKCKQAAEFKAKLKDPNVDPNTLGSVEFDKQDCLAGKWSATKADCILAAKDYDTAKKCP
jgi:hypothetical protein